MRPPAVDPTAGRNGELAVLRQRIAQLESQIHVEQRLGQSIWQAFSDLTSDFVYSFLVGSDGELTFEWASSGYFAFNGYTPEELQRDGWRHLPHPEDIGIVERRLARLLAGETVSDEYRIIHKDGQVRWLRASSRPERDPRSGRITRVLGAGSDITERRQAEQALRESEERFRLLAENATDVITKHAPDGTYRYVSPAIRSVVGYEPAQLLGRSPYEFFHPDDVPGVRDVHDQVLLQPDLFSLTFRFRRPDGSYVWMETTLKHLRDAESGQIEEIICVSRDVSERIAAEGRARQHLEQLCHLARVATMGEMASGLAHELNQPLCAIASYAQACLRLLDRTPTPVGDLRRALESVAGQAERSGQIIRRMRGFVRRTAPQHKPVQVNDAVRNALSFVASELRDREVSLRLSLAEDLPPVPADRLQIEQVLLNLIRNGLDALPMRGPAAPVLELRTAQSADGDGVEVAVLDNGVGLPEHHALRVFEPFFSTKPEGMGMGLAICRSIIAAHGGTLTCEPNPPRGAVFRFRLPRVAPGGLHAP